MKILLAASLSDERTHVYPDLGLGYLAALARNAGHDLRYEDCILNRYTIDDWARVVTEYQPDLVGITAYSAHLPPVDDMLRRVKQSSEDVTTVVGGPHPTVEKPGRVFEQLPNLDYAFAGEGETGWVPFLEQLESGHKDFGGIRGLIWRDPGGSVHANEKAFIEDLDTLPLPAWDLIQPRRYRWGLSFMTTKHPTVPIMTTRGCPYFCTFCVAQHLMGREVRRRSVDNIIEEIKLLQRDFGVRSIDLVDENYAYHRDLVMEFCERLLSENIKIAWNCPHGIRLAGLDEEMIVMMERAGCFGVSCGVESGSDRILKKIKKELTVEEIREQITMIKRATKMKVQGFMMIGFPGETREEIEATVRLALSLPFDFVVFRLPLPMLGTELHGKLVQAGVINPDLCDALEGMGPYTIDESFSSIPGDEMKKIYRNAYLRFYARPRALLNLLRQVRCFAQVQTLSNGVYRLLRPPKAGAKPARAPAQRQAF